MSGYPNDPEFKRNEKITLAAIAIFSELTKVELKKRQELIKKYNELVGKLKNSGRQ